MLPGMMQMLLTISSQPQSPSERLSHQNKAGPLLLIRNNNHYYENGKDSFIHSFILNIYIAPLQESYSEALPTPVSSTV